MYEWYFLIDFQVMEDMDKIAEKEFNKLFNDYIVLFYGDLILCPLFNILNFIFSIYK